MSQPVLKKVSLFVLTTAVALILSSSAAAQDQDHSIFLQDVSLSAGVTTDIHLRVYVNENVPCNSGSRSLFVVHGYAHSAPVWGPLIEELFIDNPTGVRPCRVISIDLPGHGLSPYQKGSSFRLCHCRTT